MKEIEIWKSVKGFEGLYEISNFGRLRNVPHFVTREYQTKTGKLVKDKLFINQTILKQQKRNI